MATRRRQHSPALKARLALAALQGESSIAQLARVHDVHANLIARWRDELKARSVQLFEAQRPAQLAVAAHAAETERVLGTILLEELTADAAGFLQQLQFGDTHLLFNALNDVQFWIKDSHSRYVHVNSGFLHNYSLNSVAEVSGRTDYDLSPTYLAERFFEDDQRLLQTGRPMFNHLELVGHHSGVVNWFNTTKAALLNKRGHIVGTCGVTYALSDEQVTSTLYGDLGPVVDAIRSRISEQIVIADLADIMSLSLSAFERRFKKFFQCSPSQYIKRVRIRLACEILMTSDRSITDIAFECGFNDHSYLSREFKALMNCTPRAYRKRFSHAPTGTAPGQLSFK